jgi:hypothetical protein
MQLNPPPIQDVSATQRGAVSLVNQVMGAGDKTFPGSIFAFNLSGTNTGDLTLAAIGAVPNASGATLVGQLLNLQPANASFGGVLTTLAQPIAGSKAFIDKMAVGFATTPAVSTLQVGATIDALDVSTFVAINAHNQPATTNAEGLDVWLKYDGSFDTSNAELNTIGATLTYESSVSTTGHLFALLGWGEAYGSTTVFGLSGVESFVRTDTGMTVSNAAALHSRGVYKGGGTITRGYGLYLQNNNGSATTTYQIFSEGTSPTGSNGFYTSSPGTRPFVLTSTNQVGIGTISPSGPLHVLGASGGPIIVDDTGQVGIGAAPAALFQVTATTGSFVVFNNLATGATFSHTSTLAGNRRGFDLNVIHSGGSSATNVFGFASAPRTSGAGGATLVAGYYTSTIGSFGAGAIGTAASYYATSHTAGAGITTNASFYSQAQSGGTLNAGFYAAPFNSGTTNFPFYYAGASSTFKVYGVGRTRVTNTDGLTADFGGGTMVTAFESNVSTGANASVTHAFGTYTAASVTGTLGLSGGLYGYNADLSVAHTAGTVATVAALNISTSFTSNGPVGNVFGLNLAWARPSGTSVITNQFGVYINPVVLATGQNYSIWASGPSDGSTSSWQVSGKAKQTSWVQDQFRPDIPDYLGEAIYAGTAHDTLTGINHVSDVYFDVELFGSLSLTSGASAIFGSIYNAKTGGTVAEAVSITADFYSDTAAPTYTNVIAFKTQYEWNAVPTIVNQYGIKLARVDKGTTKNFAIYYDTGQFSVDKDGFTVAGAYDGGGVWAYALDAQYIGYLHNSSTTPNVYSGRFAIDGSVVSNNFAGVYYAETSFDSSSAVNRVNSFEGDIAIKGSGNITHAWGYVSYMETEVGRTGTIGDATHFYAYNFFNQGGTLTDQYGFYADPMTGATNNYPFAYDKGGTKQWYVGGDGVVVYNAVTSLTAFAGGGQASATALTAEVNFVITVATAADSVKLPTAVLGKRIVVHNRGANSCNVYPVTGGAIDALGTNNAFALGAGTSKEFDGQTSTQWYSR